MSCFIHMCYMKTMLEGKDKDSVQKLIYKLFASLVSVVPYIHHFFPHRSWASRIQRDAKDTLQLLSPVHVARQISPWCARRYQDTKLNASGMTLHGWNLTVMGNLGPSILKMASLEWPQVCTILENEDTAEFITVMFWWLRVKQLLECSESRVH